MHLFGFKVSIERNRSARSSWTSRSMVISTGVAMVFTSGVAYAFWSSTSTGSGSASARNFAALTINAGTAPTGQLYPGLTADGSTAGGDLVLSVTNPNPFPVTITSVAAGTGSITVTGAKQFGTESQTDANNACAATTGVSIITKSSPSVTYQTGSNIPANQSSAFTVTISKIVSMSTASATECQGATFTFASTGVSLGLASA